MTTNDKDPYVHGMDWGKEIKDFRLNNYKRYQYNLISKYIGKNILEVGSGNRLFTHLIAEHSSFERLISIEPSGTLLNLYADTYSFPDSVSFDCQDLFDVNPDTYGAFDTITMIHVLEHIEDDKKAIDHLYNLLNENGHLLIEVPAMPFLFSPHDTMVGHFRRYTKKHMRSIVDLEKFRMVDLWYQDPIGILGSLLYFKIKKVQLKSEEGVQVVTKQGKFYDQKLIPFQEKIEKYIRFPLGLSLTAVLEKR